jgi:hypothetical protein
MTKTEIAILVISSGLAAGLVQALVTLVSGRFERQHRSDERRAIEQHERTLRREQAHDAARDTFLPMAETLAIWAERHAHEIHTEWIGDFIDVGTMLPVPTTQPQVLDLLRSLMYRHPTPAVRSHARSLYEDIDGQWSEIFQGDIPEPTLEQASDWLNRTRELVQLVHIPEPDSGA